MLQFLDIFFIVFHTALTLFNLFGWLWKKTRKLNLVTLLLTAASWFVLGAWYGCGYCFCTDWHWQVRRELGDTDMPYSYIKFLVDLFLGTDVNATAVDYATGICFGVALVCSVWVNLFRDK